MPAKPKTKPKPKAKPKRTKTLVNVKHKSDMTFMAVDSGKRLRFKLDDLDNKNAEIQLERVLMCIPNLDMEAMGSGAVEITGDIEINVSIKQNL